MGSFWGLGKVFCCQNIKKVLSKLYLIGKTDGDNIAVSWVDGLDWDGKRVFLGRTLFLSIAHMGTAFEVSTTLTKSLLASK